MQQYSNVSGIPLSIAVFLATDHYDHNPDPNTISATTLLKSVRQIVLSGRNTSEDVSVDLMNMMPSRLGTAIHNGIEDAWKSNYQNAMKALGYPDKVIKKVVINPVKTTDLSDLIPVYMEQRAHKQVGSYTVSGKFDFIGDGRVEDFKSTTAYSVMSGNNNEKYSWQGSIYRWLNPEIITKNDIAIQFILTDWSKIKAMSDPKYPQQRSLERIIPLKSVKETEIFIHQKIALIEQYKDSPEEMIPLCTDDDLWRSEPQFKYYKNPASTKRSTKNFDNKQDAYFRLSEDGNVGVVREVPGSVMACKYCAAFTLCSQKDALIANGDLLMEQSTKGNY
jgi:hypothetical protein